MAAQQVRWRRQKTSAYASGVKDSQLLSRGMVYRDLFINLRGQLTCTAANNTRANTKVGDEWAFIKRIDIMANSSDVIRSYTGEQLRWLNYFWFGFPPKLATQLGDAVSNGAASGTLNPVFNTTLCIPFWSPGLAKPFSTCLDSGSLSDFRIEITYGSHTDINANATGFTVTPTVEISSNESLGVSGPFILARNYPIVTPITGANPEFRQDIPVGPQYRGFLINVKDSTGVTDTPWNYPTDTAGIKNFQLISGTTVYFDLSEPVVNQIPILRRGMSFNQNIGYNKVGSPATNIATSNQAFSDSDLFISAASKKEAWYYLDLLGDGYMTEAIDSFQFAELYLKFQAVAACQVTVIPFQLVPTRE